MQMNICGRKVCVCVCFAIMNSYLLLPLPSHTLWVNIFAVHTCVRARACIFLRARVKIGRYRLADYQSLCKRFLSVCSALFVGGICGLGGRWGAVWWGGVDCH